MKITLDTLPQGTCGKICSMHVTDAMRNRLLNFGLIEGTKISCLRETKSLRLYHVRGTMIALRNTDGADIWVEL